MELYQVKITVPRGSAGSSSRRSALLSSKERVREVMMNAYRQYQGQALFHLRVIRPNQHAEQGFVPINAACVFG